MQLVAKSATRVVLDGEPTLALSVAACGNTAARIAGVASGSKPGVDPIATLVRDPTKWASPHAVVVEKSIFSLDDAHISARARGESFRTPLRAPFGAPREVGRIEEAATRAPFGALRDLGRLEEAVACAPFGAPCRPVASVGLPQ